MLGEQSLEQNTGRAVKQSTSRLPYIYRITHAVIDRYNPTDVPFSFGSRKPLGKGNLLAKETSWPK